MDKDMFSQQSLFSSVNRSEELDTRNGNRLISSTKNMSDVEVENKLRPMTFDEYVGQEKIKSNLKVYIAAAKKRKEGTNQ